MNRATYDTLMQQAQLLGGLAARLDEEEIREAIRDHDATHMVAPIMAPSAYLAGHERVTAMTGLLRAVQRLGAAARHLQKVVEETEPKAERARAEARAILGGGG